MRIPTITGVIDRRILVNFTVDPEIAKVMVPAPFSPQIVNGKAIAGICLIRLKELRPKGLPAFIGVGSENGAHRIAVEWQEGDETKEGVYIPRRDTSSLFNTIVGAGYFLAGIITLNLMLMKRMIITMWLLKALMVLSSA